MIIEWLEFQVEPKLREQFIDLDEKIWTKVLQNYSGFLSKEVWLDPSSNELIFLVIKWQTKRDWLSVPKKVLEETEKRFAEQMGKENYNLLQVTEYQIRKFS